MGLAIVETAALSDVGRQRASNEDSYFEASRVFAVADGMGGARAGEVASQIAVEEFSSERDQSAPPEAQLAEVARAANRKIYELAQSDEARAGMGTTLTAVMVGDRDIAIGHVGDSRVYRLRDGGLERLTHDHSLVDELVRQGKLTPEEAEVHPQRSIITRALGPEPDVDVETLSYPARDGDVYLLCSDGLTGMIGEQEVNKVLVGSPSLQQAAEQLVAAANRAGGKDNITVVLFRLEEKEERTAEEKATLSGGEESAAIGEATRRARMESQATRPPARAPSRPAPARPAPPPAGRSRARRVLVGLLAGLLVAALGVGLWVGSRQVYFVGTDDHGLVALYRGLPYELPLGIDLFDEDYTTSVPAGSVVALGRRCVLLEHELGSRGDRLDLIRQIERGTLQRGSGGSC